MTAKLAGPPCLGRGHAKHFHLNGSGLCLVASCALCLIYRPAAK